MNEKTETSVTIIKIQITKSLKFPIWKAPIIPIGVFIICIYKSYVIKISLTNRKISSTTFSIRFIPTTT